MLCHRSIVGTGPTRRRPVPATATPPQPGDVEHAHRDDGQHRHHEAQQPQAALGIMPGRDHGRGGIGHSSSVGRSRSAIEGDPRLHPTTTRPWIAMSRPNREPGANRSGARRGRSRDGRGGRTRWRGLSCRWSHDAEVGVRMPGDDLLPTATLATHPCSRVGAAPERVWPGSSRWATAGPGWYSIDLLDNGGRPSASRGAPSWRTSGVGNRLPAGRSGRGPRRLRRRAGPAYAPATRTAAATWTFLLVMGGDLPRARKSDGPSGRHPTWASCCSAASAADRVRARILGVTQRRQLEGIRERAAG